MVSKKIIKFLKEDSKDCIIRHEKKNHCSSIPVVRCYRISYGQVGFWCPYCNKLHLHGWADGMPNGHRVEHCFNEKSVFRGRGYYLECVYDFYEVDKCEVIKNEN